MLASLQPLPGPLSAILASSSNAPPFSGFSEPGIAASLDAPGSGSAHFGARNHLQSAAGQLVSQRFSFVETNRLNRELR